MKLTREQRAQLFAGGTPKISGEGKPPDPGHRYHLSSRMTLVVKEVRKTKMGGWSLRYEIHDRRDPVRLLKRTPSIHFADWEDRSQPKTLEEQEAWQDEAAQESAYTSSLTPLADAGEAVSKDDQKRLTAEAHARYLGAKGAKSLADRVAELETAHRRGADIRNQLVALTRRVEAAERRLQRDVA